MHRRVRRVLSLLFILTFLVAAPALIISTAGYRYNFLKGRIERTGVLFVSSKPSGAHIVLNGADTDKSTPSRVRRLLPGTYEVVLEKDGYRPWKKTVEIRSRETTFLNSVPLFLEGFPEPVLDGPVERADFSPDRRYAAVLSSTESETELRVIDIRSGEVHFPYRTENVSGASLEIVWSPDSGRFFMKRMNGKRPVFFLWDRKAPDAMTELIGIAPALYEDAFWSQEGRFLHAVADGLLHSIDVEAHTAVEQGPAADTMRIIGSTVFGIFRDEGGTKLVRRGLQDGEFDVIGDIPDGTYRHLTGDPDRIALLDEEASRLLVIDPSAQPNELTYHELDASDASWSVDGVLLYRNDLELHTFDPNGSVDRLITRLGGQLKDAEWLPGYGLVLVSNGSEAILTEASGEPDRSIGTVARFTELSDITVDGSGTRAWFVGRIGSLEGLWTLKLR